MTKKLLNTSGTETTTTKKAPAASKSREQYQEHKCLRQILHQWILHILLNAFYDYTHGFWNQISEIKTLPDYKLNHKPLIDALQNFRKD